MNCLLKRLLKAHIGLPVLQLSIDGFDELCDVSLTHGTVDNPEHITAEEI